MAAEITLEGILKELYNISGFRISIYDTEFNEVIAYPKNAFLLSFQRLLKKYNH